MKREGWHNFSFWIILYYAVSAIQFERDSISSPFVLKKRRLTEERGDLSPSPLINEQSPPENAFTTANIPPCGGGGGSCLESPPELCSDFIVTLVEMEVFYLLTKYLSKGWLFFIN